MSDPAQDYQLGGDLGVAPPVKDGDVIKNGDLTNDLRMLTGDTPIGFVVPDKLAELKASPKWKGEATETPVPVQGGVSVADGSDDAKIGEPVDLADASGPPVVVEPFDSPADVEGALAEAERLSTEELAELAPADAINKVFPPVQVFPDAFAELRGEVEFYRARIREHWESTQTSPRDECDQDLKLWAALERPLP